MEAFSVSPGMITWLTKTYETKRTWLYKSVVG